MAKGFTVKKTNTKEKDKGPEWDYEVIKERMRAKGDCLLSSWKGMFMCFMKNFVQLCFDLVQNQMSIQISQDYSSMVN